MPPASPWADRGILTEMTLAALFGGDTPVIDRSLAMSLATVARCRHRLVSTVARLPLVASRGLGVLDPQPRIVRQPEADRPRALTMGWVADALLFYGRAWLVGVEWDAPSDGGRVRRMQFVPEGTGRYDTDGNLIGLTGQDRDIPPEHVFRVDGPHEGLLTYGAKTLERAWRLERAADKAADNPVPSIDLHQTGGQAMSSEEIDALIERWATARRTTNGGIAYTSQAIEAKALGANVEDLLIDGRKSAALDLVRACGAPAWLADVEVGGTSITYANVASRNRDIIDDFVAPYLQSIAGRMSMDDILPAGTWCQFDLTEFLRSDFSERMTAYKTATEAGIYSIEELKDIERGRSLE